MNVALAEGSLLGERSPGAAVSSVGPVSAGWLGRSLPWAAIQSPLFRKYCFLPPLDFPALLTSIHSQILIFIFLFLFFNFTFTASFLLLGAQAGKKTNKTFTINEALLLSPCAFLPVPLLYLSLLITPPPHFLSYYSSHSCHLPVLRFFCT